MEQGPVSQHARALKQAPKTLVATKSPSHQQERYHHSSHVTTKQHPVRSIACQPLPPSADGRFWKRDFQSDSLVFSGSVKSLQSSCSLCTKRKHRCTMHIYYARTRASQEPAITKHARMRPALHKPAHASIERRQVHEVHQFECGARTPRT